MAEVLSVVSTGALTAVGLSGAQTCTAIRARISGFKESLALLQTAEWEPLVAATVPLRPRPSDERAFARLCALARLALEECLAGLTVEPGEIVLLLGVREPHRRRDDVAARLPELIPELERALGVRFHDSSRLLPFGNASVFAGLVEARRMLSSGVARVCVVGGVDSLLGSADRARLELAYRLNREGEGQGLVPGEAAAFVAVELAGGAGEQFAIQGIGLAQEDASTTVLSDGHPTGRGLQAAWTAALRDARCDESAIALRVSDLNGERYGAIDALIAVTRFYRSQRDGLPIWHPAESVGEVGAAVGALLLVVAGRALARSYAPAGLVICETSSEAGMRAACVLRATREDSVRSGTAFARPSLPLVVTQHAEDASFLWSLRDTAATAPNYDLRNLAHLDDRLEAHLDGLRAAGEDGWREVEAALTRGAGESFAAAVLALESQPERLEAVLASAEKDPSLRRGLVSALGWLPLARVNVVIERLLASPSPRDQSIGLRAVAAHRVAPPGAVEALASARDPHVASAALRTAAELGMTEMLGECLRGLRSEDAEQRFACAAAAALLGDRSGIATLREVAELGGARSSVALALAVRLCAHDEALAWHEALSASPPQQRNAVELAGALGDPALAPWLLEVMQTSQLARLAGESFALLCGVELERDRLAGAPLVPAPSDEGDALPSVEADDALAWPDPQRVRAWWDENRRRFRAGQRYLGGRPAGHEAAHALLRVGSQRQRRAAALELKLAQPSDPLFEVRAPGFRQAESLSVRFR